MLKLTSSVGNEIWKFDSVAEMDRETNPDFARDYVGNTSFIGRELKTFDDVKDAITSNWDEGILTMMEFSERLENETLPEIKSLKARRRYNNSEGEVDTDRMLGGDPNYYFQMEKEQDGKLPEVTIVIDCTGEYYRDAMDLLWRGAAAIAMTKILEEKGYRSEIWACSGSRFYDEHPDRGVVVATQLKKTSDPLDVSTLINTVSGWFFRTEMFTLWATIARREGKTLAFGLGRPYSLTQAELDLITVDEKRVYSTGVFTFSGAASLMINEIKKIADQE